MTQKIPTPPPLPPSRPPQKTSNFALKVAAAPPGWGFESSNKEAIKDFWDPMTPPAGTYFFYGTLQDPSMLAEILELETLPTLRPAFVIGYELKLWGQYPALVYGKTGDLVEGLSFNVLSEAAAARLAAYETKNYWPAPCNVRMKDSEGNEEVVEGWSFMYCGPAQDLSEGVFDLGVWLRRIGR